MTSKVAILSGGVGGARLARGFEYLSQVNTTVIVNVGDDDHIYGLAVSPDLDTVLYTLAEVEGPHGWGRRNDTTVLMGHLADLGVDTSFSLGDTDAALNLYRTMRLQQGHKLHEITASLADQLGIRSQILPVSNDPVATKIITPAGEHLDFQDYFVRRGQQEEVSRLDFAGAAQAQPAPGVVEAIGTADLVIIGPSNPPLSIWPILALEPVKQAVQQARRVVAVSPLIGGQPWKGPAARVMASLGLPAGNRGVIQAYQGIIHHLVINRKDAADLEKLAGGEVQVHPAHTWIGRPEEATALAHWLIDLR